MPTSRHTWSFPTHIEYGPGAVKDLAGIVKQAGLKKGLLVTDKGLEKVGLPNALSQHFTNEGMELLTFSNVKSNPTDDNVYAGSKLYKESGAEFIVALGGGSPIDVAKVIKLLATHEGPLEQYDDMKGGSNLIKNNMPPVYAIPTTAGTGSEVGRSSVITLKSTNKKTIIFSPYFMPTIAALDPEYTVSLPPKLTAATGVDAFVHNIEAYLIDDFHPFADGLAKEGILRSFKNLPTAVKNGQDIAARGEMLVASSMGATAFQKGLGVNHSIAHALGVFYDTHHGLANASVLVEVLKFNLGNEIVRNKMAALGEMFGSKNDADAVVETIKDWLLSIDMPTDVKGIGIKTEDLPAIEEYALEDPCCPMNPQKVEKGDVTRILQNIL
ncbi:MAG: iron-containing alcohol dehydrogenase [Calditrichaeota bacterium]|nr:iron-containing alcohol dehydrogenase [Calditrichota bacterium]